MSAIETGVDLAARSRSVKRLFPIYHLFTERFGLPEPPISDARALKSNTDPAMILSTEEWMDELDRKIDAFQMRSVVQSSNVGASELRILALLERLLAKPAPDSADRSKIDFLLAQLLATRLSLHSEHTPTLAEVADVLEPVTGKADTVSSIPALETLTSELLATRRLREVKQKSIIERGREIKNELGDTALRPENLIACSRFNFLLRKHCFELMKEEVKLTLGGLKRLSEMGVVTLDCSAAKMGGAENLDSLMEICRTWQERKADDYAHDNPFSQVLALQEIVEKAAAAPVEAEATERQPSPSTPHAEEPLKPKPDVIQIYAELAALRREHQQLAERVEQQGIRMSELRHAETELRDQLTILRDENARLRALATEPRHTLKMADEAKVAPEFTVSAPPALTEENHPARLEVALAETATPETPIAETEATPAVAHVAEPAHVPSMQEIFQSLAHRMEQIREALVAEKVNVRKEAPSHLKINHVSIMLTASETQAFLSASSQAAELICRGVAARFLLLETTKDLEKGGSNAAVTSILTICEGGATQLQEQAANLPPEQAERVLETAHLLTKALKAFPRK